MAECCAQGHLHEHEAAKGDDVVIAGRPAYLVVPPLCAAAIIIVTDVYGYKLPNVRRIADQMALEGGFMVVVPDLLDGDALPLDAFKAGFTPDIQAWFGRHADSAHVLSQIKEVITEVKRDHGIGAAATAGYCWGGKFAILAAAMDEVDAFSAAHPSRVAVPADVETITKPGIFILAETDAVFPPADVESTKTILSGKPDLMIEFKQYPGTTHGFAVRGSETDPVVVAAREDARESQVAFFRKVLG